MYICEYVFSRDCRPPAHPPWSGRLRPPRPPCRGAAAPETRFKTNIRPTASSVKQIIISEPGGGPLGVPRTRGMNKKPLPPPGGPPGLNKILNPAEALPRIGRHPRQEAGNVFCTQSQTARRQLNKPAALCSHPERSHVAGTSRRGTTSAPLGVSR